MLNIVCPNKVRTNINSQEVFDKIEAAGVSLIPMQAVLDEIGNLMGPNDLSGACIEIAPKVGGFVREPPDFIDLDSKISAGMTAELSRALHEMQEG
jgi:hypothetical protein